MRWMSAGFQIFKAGMLFFLIYILLGLFFSKRKKNWASQIRWVQITAPSDVAVFKGLLSSDIFNAVPIWTVNLATNLMQQHFAFPGSHQLSSYLAILYIRQIVCSLKLWRFFDPYGLLFITLVLHSSWYEISFVFSFFPAES